MCHLDAVLGWFGWFIRLSFRRYWGFSRLSVVFACRVGMNMDFPMTPSVESVTICLSSGRLVFRNVVVHQADIQWMMMSPEERAMVQQMANEQWDRERVAAGDPPYSIGNDWLQDLDKVVQLQWKHGRLERERLESERSQINEHATESEQEGLACADVTREPSNICANQPYELTDIPAQIQLLKKMHALKAEIMDDKR